MSIARHLRVLDCSTEETAMPSHATGAIKVAFATSDMRHVDQHFGSAKSFSMYDIDMDGSVMTDVVEFGALAQDGNEDKLEAKIKALSACAAVYVQAIGGSAISKLARIGVQPVKVQPGTPVSGLIADIQNEMRAGPGSWVARALKTEQNETRFDDMEAEGWHE